MIINEGICVWSKNKSENLEPEDIINFINNIHEYFPRTNVHIESFSFEGSDNKLLGRIPFIDQPWYFERLLLTIDSNIRDLKAIYCIISL